MRVNLHPLCKLGDSEILLCGRSWYDKKKGIHKNLLSLRYQTTTSTTTFVQRHTRRYYYWDFTNVTVFNICFKHGALLLTEHKHNNNNPFVYCKFIGTATVKWRHSFNFLLYVKSVTTLKPSYRISRTRVVNPEKDLIFLKSASKVSFA